MSDPALLVESGYEVVPGNPYKVRRQCPGTVLAQTNNGIVHRVMHILVPLGCEKGQWRGLELACGQYIKHHPKKLDRSATGTVTCLGCVAFSK